MTPELTLAEVWAYARCPFRYFWRYKARIVPPPTAWGLVEENVRRALCLYYGDAEGGPEGRSDQPELTECLEAVWRARIEGWGGGDGTWAILVEFASTRARVLESFLDGRAAKPDGARFKAPGLDVQAEMNAEHKRRATKAGIAILARQLGERLCQAPVRVTEEYGVAQAFADSVEIVERNTWPSPDTVDGIESPYEVELVGECRLKATADLVIGTGEGEVTIEVHDYDRPECLPVALVRRDLRVVAARYARSKEWNGVRGVVHRHVRSGATVGVSGGSGTGRLLTAVIGAAAGIRHQVYVPRLAVQSRSCLSCPFHELCTNDQDVLDTLDPTLLGALRRPGAEGQ